MADAKYQPKIYSKQGAEEFVVANSGTLTIESGGDLTIESGGAIAAESGGSISVESGGFFDVNNDQYTVTEMNAALYQAKVYTFGNQSTTGSVWSDNGGSSPPIIPSGYGTIVFDASGPQGSTFSARLCSALFVGQRLRIIVRGGGGSFTSTMVGFSLHCGGGAGGLGIGASVVGRSGSDVSIIEFLTSTNSGGTIELLCTETGLWSVVDLGPEDQTVFSMV